MIVIDASVVLDLQLRSASAAAIEDRIFGAQPSLHCPHLLDLEVVQVLRRHERQGGLDAKRAQEALQDLEALPLVRYPHEPFLERIWTLRASMTAYEAAYIALAEALQAPLLTRDGRLASAPGHEAQIEVVGV